MKRELQTFCSKDCQYNDGSFCRLPFDTACPNVCSTLHNIAFTRWVATPYGKCPVCGAVGPCDVASGVGVEYLFRCPQCREVSWIPAERYEYSIEYIKDDVDMVDDDVIDDEKPTKSGTTCIICGERYEIENPDDGHICEKCKGAIKRLREIFDDVDANSEELDSSEGTEDGVTTVGATTDEPMTVTLWGDELHGLCSDTDGDDVTWFIGQVCDEPDDEDESCESCCIDCELDKPDDDEDDVYPMECDRCDLYGKKPCIPNSDGKNGRCSHCTQDWCVRLEEQYAKLSDEDIDATSEEEKEKVEQSKRKESEQTPRREPVMTLKDFVARFITDGAVVEIIHDDYLDAFNGFASIEISEYIVEDGTLRECPETLLAANVLTVCTSEYLEDGDIAIYVDRPDGKKTKIHGRDGRVIGTI